VVLEWIAVRKGCPMSFAAEDLLMETPDGFEGAVAGLTLSDVIQMNAMNRFSGGITVHYRQKTGVIFFRDGEIIHAEQGESSGETAFYEILRWPGGKFNLQPKVTTTSLTIREGWKFLLLEACRLADESRNRPLDQQQFPERSSSGGSGGNGMNATVSEKLSHIPGVDLAVLLTKEGTPVGDTGYAAENLAARTIYLAMIGDRLGGIFGVGTVKAATLQGKTEHLLLFESKSHYLSIAVNGESQPGVVEAEVRKALSPKK
jgi:predicted regulator of Ras-like GTPase activity (Roadblock/LC7/MglB family)